MSSETYKINRLKLQNLPIGKTNIPLYVLPSQGTPYLLCTKTIDVKGNNCLDAGDYIYLKYLSRNGEYRFIPLQKIYSVSEQSQSIGEVSRLVDTMRLAQSNKNQLGYTTTKSIEGSCQASIEDIEQYMDIFASPKVYLQKDTSQLMDDTSNWLIVTVENPGNVINTKKLFQKFNIKINLPEIQNITM